MRKKTVVTVLAGGALFIAIWGDALVWQARHLPGATPAFLREANLDRHVELTLRRAAGLPGEYLLGETAAEEIFRQRTPIDQFLTIVLLGLAVMTVLLAWVRLRKRRDLLIWMLWIAATLYVIVAADLVLSTTMTGYIRYTILASPCIYAIIAGWNWPDRKFLRYGLVFAVVAALIISAVHRGINPAEPKEDWREAAAQLDSSARKNDLIVFFNQDPWVAPGIWYMCLRYYSPSGERPWLLLRGQPDENLRREIDGRSSLWLVGIHAEETAELLLPGWRAENVVHVSPDVSICQMYKSND